MSRNETIPIQLGKIKDAAQVGEAYASFFLPKLWDLSDRTRSEDQMKPFVRAARSIIEDGASALASDRQRQIFSTLCRQHLEREIGFLSAQAAHHNRQHWDRVNGRLLDAQIDRVRHRPQDDDAFKGAMAQGLTALESHDAQMGVSKKDTEIRLAQFLSRLLTARLEVLAPVNIAQAKRVHDQYQTWLAPECRDWMVGYLDRMERIVRAGILADAIVQTGPKQTWMRKIRAVADCETDNDAVFVALLTQAVQARLDQAVEAEAKAAQTDRNALLRTVLDMPATRLEALLAAHPHLAPLWHRTDQDTRDGLLDLMRINRRDRPKPLRRSRATELFDLAIGHALHDHPKFHAQNLAHKRWNDLPALWRVTLITLQQNRGDSDLTEKIAHKTEKMARASLRHAQHYAAAKLPIFAERI